MLVQDQSGVFSFLKNALRRDEHPVEVINTHISTIFLSGDRAYKMKRAVRLPYVDFSSVEARVAACRKELELNSVTAPATYLAVRLITREPSGDYAIDGNGETCEALVEMRRFDQTALLDRIAASGALTSSIVDVLAKTVVQFHRCAPVSHSLSGRASVASVMKINDAGFATSNVFSSEQVRELTSIFQRRVSELGDLLDEREREGKIRRCHGDLHLRNIFLLNGEPRLFDCIEFSDEIATTDVLYDLAFLLMDLWHREEKGLANRLMNRYLDETDDEEGFRTLPFFMALRAAVRAHVTATQAESLGADQAKALIEEARFYFDLARALLQPAAPRLVAIGGLSGSGKTTLAEALAPLVGAGPGARIIESDRVRKAMHAVPRETKLPAAAYRPEIFAKVYREMVWRARLLLKGGGCVIVDAVFDKPRNRQMIEDAAALGRHRFQGIWLEADPAVLRQRVFARPQGVSDATVDVLEEQLVHELGTISWKMLDASEPVETLVHVILRPTGAAKEGFDVSI
ncbi:bifunctional aminoglycoside phosphotransferase/ATP-binding protein [Rhizobium bangladeshense]|uniref:bifunctional aminoglycoside phosphotransferase/ATP-binding protein n=1 Tax=Rhizobium bangladeshense TaxID=1138189 RepID=UPI001C82E3F8|nr:bifunctional aminoglycoside phosphotransferase/ATP-binding protein [Rhizobium bangladeshense]MBX4898830.1 AAA family ATPase [Rhizobium bangladeshense]